jgi:hypothetical protein
VKDRVKLLTMVTNQHFAVSDSHALLAQHVVERCLAEMKSLVLFKTSTK